MWYLWEKLSFKSFFIFYDSSQNFQSFRIFYPNWPTKQPHEADKAMLIMLEIIPGVLPK